MFGRLVCVLGRAMTAVPAPDPWSPPFCWSLDAHNGIFFFSQSGQMGRTAPARKRPPPFIPHGRTWRRTQGRTWGRTWPQPRITSRPRPSRPLNSIYATQAASSWASPVTKQRRIDNDNSAWRRRTTFDLGQSAGAGRAAFFSINTGSLEVNGVMQNRGNCRFENAPWRQRIARSLSHSLARGLAAANKFGRTYARGRRPGLPVVTV